MKTSKLKLRTLLLAAMLVLSAIPYFAIAAPTKLEAIGKVVSLQNNEDIAYATIYLRSDSSDKVIGAMATDATGKFILEVKNPGSYKLSVNYPGCSPEELPFTVSESKPKADLGTIKLVQGVTANQVVVRVEAPLVSTDIDKITYNISADPEASTQTAIEMIRKVPMLTVDGEDNIQLKGQSDYKVLVNGKTSTMMSKNFKEVLRSMPANSIKSIEVITDPPAKYDAEGLAGIINIITVRKTNNGYNGSLGLRGGIQGTKPSYGGNGYISAAIGKFALSANYGYYASNGLPTQYNTRSEYFNSERLHFLETNSNGDNSFQSHNMSLEGSYEIDTFNLITLSFWGYLGEARVDGDMFTQYFDKYHNPEPTRQYRNNMFLKNNFGAIAGNIDYQKSFKKPDQTFTASYKLDMSPGGQDQTSIFGDMIDYNSPDRSSSNSTLGSEHTFQADYVDPLGEKHLIETGLKYILRPNLSSTDQYVRAPGDTEWILDNSNPSDLDYMQHIAALYASYQFKLNKKFSIKAGARAEYTINNGTFKLKEDVPLFNRFFNVVPYLTFNYKPKDNQNIRLGYTQRLSRPGIWHLNPYVNDFDPANISTGNPNLTSAISHSFSLSYGLYGKKGNLSVSTFFNMANNTVERVATARPDGVLFTTYENIGRNIQAGGYLYGSLNFFERKLSFNLNAGADYTQYSTGGDYSMGNRGWNYRGSIYVNGQPWKNGNIYLNGSYQSSRVRMQGSSSGYSYTSIGISQSVLKKNLKINLNVNNPFTADYIHATESQGPGFVTYNETFQKHRSVTVGLTWNFGKMNAQVKKARRGISNDDKIAGGNSGGSGSGQ